VNIWENLLDLKPQSLPMELPLLSLSYYMAASVILLGTKKQRQKQWKSKNNKRWVVLVSIWTFFLAIALTLITHSLLQNLHSMLISFMLLIFIIFMGIFFDVIGTAVTAAEEIPFHAKAAKKIYGAKKSIFLVRHADLVASFCNDVIGDISGIVSGIIGTVIVVNLVRGNPILSEVILSIFLAGAVSALTVGGKALGKTLAINRPTDVVLFVARFLTTLERISIWKRNA
jgi:small-conductance mechanosensitive channel